MRIAKKLSLPVAVVLVTIVQADEPAATSETDALSNALLEILTAGDGRDGESRSQTDASADVSAEPPGEGDPELQFISGSPRNDRVFAAQPVDTSWAPDIEAAFEDVLESSGMAFVEKDVECRTSMCRAILTLPFDRPPPGFDEMMFEIQLNLRPIIERNHPRLQSILTSSDIARSPDEAMTTTIYLMGDRK